MKEHTMGVTLTDIARVFSDEAAAYEYLESKRWPSGPICPHCQSQDARYIEPKNGTGARTARHRGSATVPASMCGAPSKRTRLKAFHS